MQSPALVKIFWREVGQRTKSTNLSKWNGKFQSVGSDRFKWTTSKGCPKYSGRTEPKRTFPFDLRPKFRYFRPNGKQLQSLIWIIHSLTYVCLLALEDASEFSFVESQQNSFCSGRTPSAWNLAERRTKNPLNHNLTSSQKKRILRWTTWSTSVEGTTGILANFLWDARKKS